MNLGTLRLEVNISKYVGYFHDGSLIDIHHEKNNIILSMASAEIDPEEIKDDIPLSPNDTLRGKLHIEHIYDIKVKKKSFEGKLQMLSDAGDIFSFDLEDNKVELKIIWIRFNPKPVEEVGFSVIEISAKNIYWEPVPDLVDPFW